MFLPVVLTVTVLILNQHVLSRSISSPVNKNCTVFHDGRLLTEGESIENNGKLYKVEDCVLHRAYHACGTYLLQMVSIACEVAQQQKQKSHSTRRFRRFLPRKLLTEACCHTLCTVSEMTRYCP